MPHPHQVLALQQCNSASIWQVPCIICSHVSNVSVQVSLCTSLPAVQMASSTVRTFVFNRSSENFRNVLRCADQICRGVSNPQSGRNMEELELGEDDLDALEIVRKDEEFNNNVDQDSDSLAFAVSLAEAANDVKGSEIQGLCARPLIYWACFVVVVTAFSKPQIDAVGKSMWEVAEEKFNPYPKSNVEPNALTSLDFGDMVVHMFLPKEREYYNLE